MTWETWLLYAATDAFAYLVPGPAALFIVSQALARGAGRTSWAILGVLSAEAMYFILSATGLALLLTASYDLFFAIKWLGAAYLVWLGIQAFRGQAGAFAVDPARQAHLAAALRPARLRHERRQSQGAAVLYRDRAAIREPPCPHRLRRCCCWG